MINQINLKTFHFHPSPIEIEVKDLSFIKDLPKLLGTPHKVSFYQLIWISEGNTVVRVDFRDIALCQNDVLVISPGQVCEFDVESDYNGKIILFTNTFFTITDADSNFLSTSLVLSLLNRNQVVSICPLLIENLVTLLEEELKNPSDYFQSGISQSLLRIILFEAERKLTLSSTSYINNIARDFFNAVEKYFKTNRQVKYYADLLAVSEKALLRELRSTTSHTPKSYIEDRVLLEAKRLLSYSNLSVKEIGFELGFDEPTNFNKFFKSRVLLTPIDFRISTKK